MALTRFLVAIITCMWARQLMGPSHDLSRIVPAPPPPTELLAAPPWRANPTSSAAIFIDLALVTSSGDLTPKEQSTGQDCWSANRDTAGRELTIRRRLRPAPGAKAKPVFFFKQ
jgi:hypothetical protein